MIRIVLKRIPNNNPKPYQQDILRWEWALEAGEQGIGVRQRAIYADRQSRALEWYEVNVTGRWSWGSYHAYYDGPHCFFSVGPLHLSWRNWECKRCMDEC